MRTVFSPQGVKGVVIACQDCGANHFFEWELLRDNLEQMLTTGEPRPHEPAFDLVEDEYIQWDYGKGYVDALADTGLEPDRAHRGHAVPMVRDAVRRFVRVLSDMRPHARHGAPVPRAARPRLRRARRSRPARPRRLRTLLMLGRPRGFARSAFQEHDGPAGTTLAMRGETHALDSCTRSPTLRRACRA